MNHIVHANVTVILIGSIVPSIYRFHVFIIYPKYIFINIVFININIHMNMCIHTLII